MSEQIKKFLDEDGVRLLWEKISMQDYPNNETLVEVINAIDATKADKVNTQEKPLIGTTADTTPSQVARAMIQGRDILITHQDETYGLLGFTSFDFASDLGAVSSTPIVVMPQDDRMTVLAGNLCGFSSTDEWVFDIMEIALFNDIPQVDANLSIEGAAADAKVVGDMLSELNDMGEAIFSTVYAKDEVLTINITGDEEVGFAVDRTFEEIKAHHNKGYTVRAIRDDTGEVGHLIGYDDQYYHFKSEFNLFALVQTTTPNGLYPRVELVSLLPDTTLSRSFVAADAKAVGNALINIENTIDESVEIALNEAKESGDFNGLPGQDGKSAYDLAKEGGYTGTEVEFMAILATISQKSQVQITTWEEND